MPDLLTDAGLRETCEALLRNSSGRPDQLQWVMNLRDHLQAVRDADKAMFLSKEFQRKLWDSESVSATGMGNIDATKLIEDPESGQILWNLKSQPKAASRDERLKQIIDAWEAIKQRVIALGMRRSPRLKMYRVFAAICPEDFTTVAHQRKMRQVARALGIGASAEMFSQPLTLHRLIVDRIDAVLNNPVVPISEAFVQRKTLPWLIYANYLQEGGEDSTEIVELTGSSEKLKPLPADRRRRGMMAMRGYMTGLRGMIEFVSEGCKREDFRAHILTINPELAPTSIGTTINALIGDWGVIRPDGENLVLTPRGQGLLETGDPEEVSDWLLTRILGFDNVLHLLQSEPHTGKALVSHLQQVNPGWTTSFAPDALLGWIKNLGLIEKRPDGLVGLTEQGRAWAERIHWVPEQITPAPADSTAAERSADPAAKLAQRPSLNAIRSSFPPELHFDPLLIARIDAGLWSHARRHFAVLTGLSGAGKTQLALSYGRGLWHGEKDQDAGFFTVPVQPGWHDPSSLLGYVNPLNSETYVKTGFLDFLLQASSDPDRPYTVLLDEMNLSHPEQYLAPILSAMETGGDIELHSQYGDVNGVPRRLPYPSNLVLIGTVNMDETTHGLSDKVLDRAFVIEFWNIDLNAYPGWKTSGLSEWDTETVRTVLIDLFTALRPVRLHFGWRTVGDVLGYVREAQAGGMPVIDALDHAVYAKVLPKLRGEDSLRLQKALKEVQQVLSNAKLIESSNKLNELCEDLAQLGSARFWR